MREFSEEEKRNMHAGIQEIIAGLCKIQDIFIPTKIHSTGKGNIDIETIRAVLVKKTKEGKGAGVKELLKIFQAEKLSDISEEHFSELFQMANKL